mmetsp:Transcript_27651/g.69977  ORF Transcript_27651/g.69977 Transcript_27651/m.69977 type:complete len:90 (+) Transcript_27651:295-564(+)
MWLRCLFSTIFAAVLYEALHCALGPQLPSRRAAGGCGGLFEDLHLFVTLALGVGICCKATKGEKQYESGSGSHFCAPCPEKAAILRISL